MEFENAVVFVDYENVYYSLKSLSRNIVKDGFFERLRAFFNARGVRISCINAYCNFDIAELYLSHHQSLLQRYGVNTVHTSNQGKNYSDIKITIDTLNTMYLNNSVDEIVIVSNDKDMTPLLNAIRLNKKRVSIVTIGESYNHVVEMFADCHYSYNEIIGCVPGELIVDDIENETYDCLYKYITNLKPNRIAYDLDDCFKYYMNNYYVLPSVFAEFLAEWRDEGKIAAIKFDNNKISILAVDSIDSLIKSNRLKPDQLINSFDFCSYALNQYK